MLFDTINFLLLIAVYYYVVIYSLSGDSSRDDISTANPTGSQQSIAPDELLAEPTSSSENTKGIGH